MTPKTANCQEPVQTEVTQVENEDQLRFYTLNQSIRMLF